jgi:hypothetical protein
MQHERDILIRDMSISKVTSPPQPASSRAVVQERDDMFTALQSRAERAQGRENGSSDNCAEEHNEVDEKEWKGSTRVGGEKGYALGCWPTAKGGCNLYQR